MSRRAATVRTLLLAGLLFLAAPLISTAARAQTLTVTGALEMANGGKSRQREPNKADAVVWLTPLAGVPASSGLVAPPKRHFTLVQKNKTFTPHVLVAPVGAEVDFPNEDPFFHNVFSLFDGKRFDLGLYESGSSRTLHFDKPGISYLFCNIHSEMSAVVVVLDTPYYAVSDRAAKIAIPQVPPGRYMLHIWKEGYAADLLKGLSRPVTISEDSSSFGTLSLPEHANVPLAHKNKYGRDYEDPNPPGQVYTERH